MYTYIHIPKTAGSSISSICQKIGHDISCGEFDINKLGYSQVNKFRGKYFTTVRNPYDRFLSAYNYSCKGGIGSAPDLEYQIILNSMTLDEFIDILPQMINRMVHFTPQFYFTTNESRKAPKLIICKFETLNQDLARLGFNNLPHINSTERKVTTLTDEQKEKIYEVYKEDFRLFGYEK